MAAPSRSPWPHNADTFDHPEWSSRLQRETPITPSVPKWVEWPGVACCEGVVEAFSGTAMWTPATPRQHSRDGLRYETDLTDAEWTLLEPLMPEPHQRGRPRAWPLREIVNAIFYVLRGGIGWRLLPN